MTTAATPFAEKSRLSGFRIAWDVAFCRGRTEAVDIGQQLPYLRIRQVEGRHIRAGHTIVDGAEEVLVVSTANDSAVRKIGASTSLGMSAVTSAARSQE